MERENLGCIDLRGVPTNEEKDISPLQRPMGCIDLRGIPGYREDEDSSPQHPTGCTDLEGIVHQKGENTNVQDTAASSIVFRPYQTFESDWLEAAVVRKERSEAVKRVVSTDWEPAVVKGENFLSEMTRVRMVVELCSGETARKSVIVKRFPDSHLVTQMIDDSRAFKTEIYMYNSVFPLMEKLMEKCDDTSDKLWCKCIECTPPTQLILEDLKGCGYTVVDRKKGLDLPHALLAVRSLAKFHSLSYVLLENGSLEVDRLNPFFMCRNAPYINDLFVGGFKTLVQVMRDSWTREWASVADKLETIGRNLGDRLQELTAIVDSDFKVLNHGDCWISNIMFRHNPVDDYPISIRFVDYQLCHYNTPAMDLIYFIHSSLDQTTKRDHFDLLVEDYCRCLRYWLTKYRPSGLPEGVPTATALRDQLRTLSLIGLAVTCSLKPLNKAGPQHTLEFDSLLQGADRREYKSHPDAIYTGHEIETILKEDLMYFAAEGCLE